VNGQPFDWVYEGRCWRFGDDVSVDGDLMPLDFAVQRETRAEVLKHHVMSGIDPDFAAKVEPRDLLVAGKRFAQGNPHIQGLLGIVGLGMGLVVESIPRGSLRNAVNAGLPLLPSCKGVRGLCDDGDRLRVDFASGRFENLTRGETHRFEPLDAPLLHTIAIGGWKPMVIERLRGMQRVPTANAT